MYKTALQAAAIGMAFVSFSASAALSAASTQAADKLYQANCAACHGAKMEGAVGPTLGQHAWLHGEPTKANLIKIISKGVPDKNMPAWSPALSPSQIALLADYIGANANKKLAPAPVAAPVVKPASDLLSGFTLPKGFRISVYAEGATTARSMVVSDSGIVYVGSRKAGKVYALVPRADKQTADVVTIAEGLENPIGVTLLNGALYVGEISRVIRFDNIDKRYAQKPSYEVVKVSLPNDKWHGEKVIKASPDGKLVIPVGAPCNICDTDDTKSAKIYRMNADGSQLEEIARGVRNTVGFAFHPTTKQLWFTDNGRDEMGDNTPSCELNVLTKFGQHFGFPYCHGGVVPDPKFGAGRTCEEFVEPVAKLGPHVAPLGLSFYTGKQFPEAYRNNIFVAEHGSWNRSTKIGYNVRLITLYGNKMVSDTSFIDGFLRGEEVVGRPVDVIMLADGSLLISDDYAGRIFRVTYDGK
ncbi:MULTISPECIES: c-type cytochrome [unclassified Duganella]|uniref:c-type cytochrome n=1 Tax=unclassified Duganella TaxID=2636909 RepID=UPI00088EE1CE|nr:MULTISPECIES: c-type cytochrome [unclassified Duganella]SDF48072.1 Cytochrome C oxidase, cbb3-type, subunit III [Duganella sp. OV458]SDI78872.1 Glucose/arabinose dehydrogenase, beta-propeller fold [Duganella sp. OV510]